MATKDNEVTDQNYNTAKVSRYYVRNGWRPTMARYGINATTAKRIISAEARAKRAQIDKDKRRDAARERAALASAGKPPARRGRPPKGDAPAKRGRPPKEDAPTKRGRPPKGDAPAKRGRPPKGDAPAKQDAPDTTATTHSHKAEIIDVQIALLRINNALILSGNKEPTLADAIMFAVTSA